MDERGSGVNTKQTTTTFTIPDALMDMGVSLVSALARIADAMEQRNIDEREYTAILQRDSERADGELVMRYLTDISRWEEAVAKCDIAGFSLLTATEQEYRTETRDDFKQRLDHFMIAYPWIVAHVEGELARQTLAGRDVFADPDDDEATGPLTTQDGDFCLSCGTFLRTDGSCDCDGWGGAS